MRCAGSTKTAPITANRIHNQIQISIAWTFWMMWKLL
jgi:hypothetical protein